MMSGHTGRKTSGVRVNFADEDLRVVYGIINSDICTVCGKTGELVCCDTCPAAVHLGCMTSKDMKVDTETDAPWYCQECCAKCNSKENPFGHDGNNDSSSSIGHISRHSNSSDVGSKDRTKTLERAHCFTHTNLVYTHRPAIVLYGSSAEHGQHDVAAAFLADLEGFSVHCISLSALLKSSLSNDSQQKTLVNKLDAARRSIEPVVMYLPLVDKWWAEASPALRSTLLYEIDKTRPAAPIVFFFTASCNVRQLPSELTQFFSNTLVDISLCKELKPPTVNQRRSFFDPHFKVLREVAKATREKRAQVALAKLSNPKHRQTLRRALSEGRGGSFHRTHSSDCVPLRKNDIEYQSEGDGEEEEEEELPIAPLPAHRGPTIQDLQRQRQQNQRDEYYLRELREFFRQALHELYKDPKYKYFRTMIRLDDFPDYMDHVPKPMHFNEMRLKVDEHAYSTYEQFFADLELIRDNAIAYNGTLTERGSRIVHQVCFIVVTIYILMMFQSRSHFLFFVY